MKRAAHNLAKVFMPVVFLGVWVAGCQLLTGSNPTTTTSNNTTSTSMNTSSSTKTISTVAGNGTQGSGGDGGAATSAQLFAPYQVALDSAGNLYIADSKNNKVRKVDAAGNISTIAGTGTAGSLGDGGAATSAQLYGPSGVALDSAGNVYIADTVNGRIRKVAASTGNISTFALVGKPYGMVFDAAGNLYVADYNANGVRKVSPTGTVTTVAGTGSVGSSGDNGPATSATLYWPEGVALDGSGNMYIADTFNHRIRKVNTGGTITTRSPEPA